MFSFKKIIKSQSGFSLAEVMVAAGMLGVVSLAVTQLMSNMSKGSKKLQQDAEVYGIEQRINQSMRKQSNCTASFRGENLSAAFSDVVDLDLARPAWSRSAAGDVAANKNPFAVAGTVYGAGGSRVEVENIAIAGFYDGDGPAVAGSYSLTANRQQQYTFLADGNATDAGANTTRNMGEAVIRVTFRKQIDRAGGDAQAREDHNKKTFGAETIIKYIPIRVVTNGANVIQECYGDTSNFTEASCDTIDGTIDGDGDCKNVTIRNVIANTNDPAVTVEGNLVISPDPTNLATHDSDKGSVGIGLAPNVGSASNVDIAGSVGIGTPSSGTAGDLNVGRDATVTNNLNVVNSIGVNALPTGVPGTVHIGNMLAIGATPPAGGVGTASIQNSLVVGSGTASGTVGDITASNRVGVGAANPGASGSLRVSNSVGIGVDPSGNAGDLNIARNGTITGTLAVNGVTGGNSITVNKNILTTANINEITANKHLVTREWVNNHVGQALAPAGVVSAMVGYIDNMNVSQGYEAIKAAICASMRINGTGTGNTNCDITGYTALTSVTWNSSTHLLTINQKGGSAVTTYVRNCSNSGTRCSQVLTTGYMYAASYIRSASYVQGSSLCIGSTSRCRTNFNYQRCGTGSNMVGMTTGGAIICAWDAR